MADSSFGELRIAQLQEGMAVGEFDCGDAELNEFLQCNAVLCSAQGITQTYVAFDGNRPVAFVGICTDALKLSRDEMRDEFGMDKCHPDYPAMKIARLAVVKERQGRSLGTMMVRYAVGKAFRISAEVGCRFVTADAYPGQVAFYEKCGFVRNQKDSSGENVSMRLDLLAFKPSSAQ